MQALIRCQFKKKETKKALIRCLNCCTGRERGVPGLPLVAALVDFQEVGLGADAGGVHGEIPRKADAAAPARAGLKTGEQLVVPASSKNA